MNNLDKKWIFLDRDGVLIEDRGYVHKAEDIKIMPGVIKGLQKLQSLGYKFVAITNQAGIARGYYSLETADNFNKTLISRFAEKGIKIEKIYLCPHHPEFTGHCECRKPGTALVKKAVEEFSMETEKSFFVGDKDSDILLGKNCGGKTIFLKNNKYDQSVKSDFTANDFFEVADIIEKS